MTSAAGTSSLPAHRHDQDVSGDSVFYARQVQLQTHATGHCFRVLLAGDHARADDEGLQTAHTRAQPQRKAASNRNSPRLAVSRADFPDFLFLCYAFWHTSAVFGFFGVFGRLGDARRIPGCRRRKCGFRVCTSKPENKKGEKPTGPALNPLKGSSARFPHIPKRLQPARQK